MNGPLPRRVRHKEGESGLSLALRLAHRSGASWGEFARAVGLPRSGLKLSTSLERLSGLAGVPIDRLRPLTPIWNGWGNEVDVAGMRVDPSRFLRLNLRICPFCMVEDVQRRAEGERSEDAAYLRLEWSLAFVFGCARHGARLVSRCPACGERPRWNVGPIDRCHCGFDLLGADAVRLGNGENVLLEAIVARVHGRRPARDVLSPLDHVGLPDAINLLRFLGEIAMGIRRLEIHSAAQGRRCDAASAASDRLHAAQRDLQAP